MSADVITKEKEPLAPSSEASKNNTTQSDRTSNEDTLVLPPDGGYGWVIVCASFFVNFLVDGVCFSFGIFFLEFLDTYQESKEKTSWVGSVLNGMYLTMGPIVGGLANKFGCRSVSIVGSLLAAGSLFLSTFSPNIYCLIVFYGLLTGAGFGLMYLPAIVMVGYYFEKRRALATGIAVCGSGIGGFVFAPLCEKLIETYAWRGATWIVAAICLHGIVCGLLFRPLEHRKRTSTRSSDADPKRSSEQCDIQMNNSSKVTNPAIAKVQQQNGLDCNNVDKTCAEVRSMYDLSPNCEDGDDNDVNGILTSKCTYSKSCDDIRMRKGDRRKTLEELRRPLYRQDILYGGSVHSLQQYKDSESAEEYVRSVTKQPSSGSVQTGRGGKCKAQCKAMTDVLTNMMDFSLLKNPVFCIYGMSCFLCMTGFFVPFIYLPDMAISYGMDRTQAAFLLSIIGIANTVARVGCGWVSDQSWADCLLINNCALILGGAVTMMCAWLTTYPLLAVYSFVFGSCIAAFVSLRSIIMVELMGLEKLTNAFGLVTFCQGLSAFIGAPIAGALFDATGDYKMTFYVAGGTLSLAGLICLPLRRVALCWKRRQQRLASNQLDVNGSTEVKVHLSDQEIVIVDS